MGSAIPEWKDIPKGPMSMILRKTIKSSLSDYLNCSIVCKAWRDASLGTIEPIHLRSRLPVLLIPNLEAMVQVDSNDYEKEKGDCNYYNPEDPWWVEHGPTRLKPLTRTFYSLSTRKVHRVVQLPVPHVLNCRGSSHGWLIAVREDEDLSVSLLNPFRSVGNEIQLPPLARIIPLNAHEKKISYFLVKGVLSDADPIKDLHDLALLSIIGSGDALAYWRYPSDKWIIYYNSDLTFGDILFWDNNFYVLACESDVFTVQIEKDELMLVSVEAQGMPRYAGPDEDDFQLDVRDYLVECGGHLLQVHRKVSSAIEGEISDHISNYETVSFQVFAMKSKKKSKEWVEISDLEGHVLFLGSNASFSLIAQEFPGLQPNSIYFTDDYDRGISSTPNPLIMPHDYGIYNLGTDTIEQYQVDNNTIMPATMPAAIWIQPTV